MSSRSISSLKLAYSTTLFIFCLAGPAVKVAAVERNNLAAAMFSIRNEDLRQHVNTLADDTFEGREAGSRGGHAAAGYLVQQMQKAGLKGGAADGSFFQPFGRYRNLLGMIEGSDPELKKEFLVIGAHYDHVGYGTARNSYGPTGFIHNGADDNASGTSSLLEIIDAFHNLPSSPKRSVLFAFWDGEEQGLLGSKHWVSQPSVPLSRVVMSMNMDMVGRLRNDKIEILGSRTCRGLRQMTSRWNQEFGLTIDFTWEMQANSDHHNFFLNNIPVLMPFTGLHEDYHRPSDDAEKINTTGMERISRLMFLAAVTLADATTINPFRPESRNESPFNRKQFERSYPAPGPRFGVAWERATDETGGLLIVHIDRGSPAELAGLRLRDRLVTFNSQPITDDSALRIQILAAPKESHIGFLREGTDQPQEAQVRFITDPVRVGVSWREDDAEPGSVVVTQVVPGSAAHQAGLQDRDRIYEVAGQPFATGRDFHLLVTTLAPPLPLLVEREGRLQTMILNVPPLELPNAGK